MAKVESVVNILGQPAIYQILNKKRSRTNEEKKELAIKIEADSSCDSHFDHVFFCSDLGFWRYSCNLILAYSFFYVPHGGSCRNALKEQLSVPIPLSQRVLNVCIGKQLTILAGLDPCIYKCNAKICALTWSVSECHLIMVLEMGIFSFHNGNLGRVEQPILHYNSHV